MPGTSLALAALALIGAGRMGHERSGDPQTLSVQVYADPRAASVQPSVLFLDGPSEAERYLRLSISRSFGRCVFATLDQRDPTGMARRIRAEIVRDARGRIRTSILQPESLSGNAIIDNGRTMSVLLGRERLIMIQDSPARTEGDPDRRIRLIRRNYRLSLSPGPRMFERATVVLEAKARWRGIDSRRYRLDAATGYPLRHDILSEGTVDNLFDTVALRFADAAPAGAFDEFSSEGREVIRYASSRELKSDEAKTRVGFVPIVPDRLPFGFRVSGIGLNDMPGWRSVVVRASDGLVKTSIYEWVSNPADAIVKDGVGRTIGRRRDRTVMVVSDGSALIRARLLDTVLDAIP